MQEEQFSCQQHLDIRTCNTQAHTHTPVDMCTYKHPGTQMHASIHAPSAHEHARTHVHTNARTHTCTHLKYTHMCTHTHRQKKPHVHTHVHTHTNTDLHTLTLRNNNIKTHTHVHTHTCGNLDLLVTCFVRTQNNFFVEKNPTIVNFPVKNMELRDIIPVPEGVYVCNEYAVCISCVCGVCTVMSAQCASAVYAVYAL